MKWKLGLAWQILIGLITGIIVGAIFYGEKEIITYLKPAGDIFIHLIKMIVVPIVISSIIIGVAGVGDVKKLGTLGLKALLYFEVVTTLALIIGIVVITIFPIGNGINLNTLHKSDISSYVETTHQAQQHSMVDTLVNIVPTNIIDAMARGDLLAIIFFSVLFGLGIAAIGEKGKPVLKFFEGVADAMFYVTNQIMKVAPIGVFSLIGMTVSTFGIQSLIPLFKLVVLVYGSMIFFVLFVLGTIASFVKINIFSLMKYLKDEILLAYSTASSETVLPMLMKKLEKIGCPKFITSFVVPTGYSFNLDGSSLYQAIAAMFLAQAYGINLSIWGQISLLLVLMLTSKGIAAVPGASLVVLLATLGTIGVPLEGLAFIAGIDRILDMIRVAVNVVGNALATIVISKWEGKFDEKQAKVSLQKIS